MRNTQSSNLSTGNFAGWVRLASFGIIGGDAIRSKLPLARMITTLIALLINNARLNDVKGSAARGIEG
jgi:hypothetical protein